MNTIYKTSEDLIVRFIEDKIVISNIFARVHFQANIKMVELFSFLNQSHALNEMEDFLGTKGVSQLSLIPMAHFSLGKCLLENPDNLNLLSKADEIKFEGLEKLVAYLEENFLIYSDRAEYLKRFGQKKSFLDKRHLGNFHQQIGRYAMVNLKVNIDDWWVRQKFLDDLSGVRNTPYKFIQENFIKDYFTKDRLDHKKLLDIGCGIGYYDKIFADRGAEVLGIDTNEDHIKVANNKFSSEKLIFKCMDVNSGALDTLPKKYYDIVFLSDVLLFYFVNPNPKATPLEAVVFLKQIKELLKPEGNLYILDPHGIFFLQNWYGTQDRPYAVITEYHRKGFRVSPTLEDLSEAFAQGGFLIKEIRELWIDEGMKEHNPKAFSFCSEFPQWWFFNLVKEK